VPAGTLTWPQALATARYCPASAAVPRRGGQHSDSKENFESFITDVKTKLFDRLPVEQSSIPARSLPFGSLIGMRTTTIKVDATVRDRLAVLARERGTTMGALLAEATEALERRAFFARAQEQLERLRDEDPEAWSADRAESRSWQTGTDRDTLSGHDEPGWWE
jgi:predicted DNA-binding protein